MNEHLTLSNEGANLIKAFESCMKRRSDGKFVPYHCQAGKLTIGWGHTNDHGRPFTERSVWTKEDCDAAFEEDMAGFEATVRHLVKVPLDQHQFDALVSFTYNCGGGALAQSSILAKVNRKDWEGAAKAFALWTKVTDPHTRQKITSRGLVRRRASESLLFQGIPDRDYDGHPDVQHKIVDEADFNTDETMPQDVDAPEPPKSIAQSKTAAAGVTAGFAGVLSVLSNTWDQVHDMFIQYPLLYIGLTAFFIGVGGFIVVDRKKKLDEEYV